MVEAARQTKRLVAQRRRAGGLALVVTLAIVLAIASLALVFARQMQTEALATRNGSSAQQAQQIAQGAARAVAADLWQSIREGGPPELSLMDIEAGQLGDGLYWIIRPDFLDDREPAFGVVGEAGKLNLNVATAEQLQFLTGITLDAGDAIVDWRDADEDLSEFGAEAETYLVQDPAYQAKNDDFETVEELLLVRDIDDLILFGEDANRNGALDESENDAQASGVEDNRDGTLDRGVYDFVTVYSREPGTAPDGSERFNFREGSREELAAALTARLPETRGNQIASAIGNLQSIDSLMEFYLENGITPEEQALLEGWLTVQDGNSNNNGNGGEGNEDGPSQNSTDTSTPGLIDVFSAPAEVLEALPDLEAGDGQLLVDARLAGEATAGSLTWIAEALDEDKAEDIGPSITSRSYQFSADIVAISGDGRGLHRLRVVIDTADADTTTPPVIVYTRDLTSLGWPLDPQIMIDLRAGETADTVARRYATGVNP